MLSMSMKERKGTGRRWRRGMLSSMLRESRRDTTMTVTGLLIFPAVPMGFRNGADLTPCLNHSTEYYSSRQTINQRYATPLILIIRLGARHRDMAGSKPRYRQLFSTMLIAERGIRWKSKLSGDIVVLVHAILTLGGRENGFPQARRPSGVGKFPFLVYFA